MPVIVLEVKDFTSSLFLVRTWEIISGCVTFSIMASMKQPKSNNDQSCLHDIFGIFCMFTWCFFFILTLIIHILSIIQFHNLVPLSWKNLTMTAAFLGTLMSLSASVVYLWIIMDLQNPLTPAVSVAVASCITVLAYASESYVLRTQAHEQRGYMASPPGLLKILQVWGSCLMMPLGVALLSGLPGAVTKWQWINFGAYIVCFVLSLVTVSVILGDCAGRCFLPFDRFLASFSLIGVLLYMVATVICFTKILQLGVHEKQYPNKLFEVVIMETVVCTITLLAYTVDIAFSIKLLCDRGHA